MPNNGDGNGSLIQNGHGNLDQQDEEFLAPFPVMKNQQEEGVETDEVTKITPGELYIR